MVLGVVDVALEDVCVLLLDEVDGAVASDPAFFGITKRSSCWVEIGIFRWRNNLACST